MENQRAPSEPSSSPAERRAQLFDLTRKYADSCFARTLPKVLDRMATVVSRCVENHGVYSGGQGQAKAKLSAEDLLFEIRKVSLEPVRPGEWQRLRPATDHRYLLFCCSRNRTSGSIGGARSSFA